MRGPSYPPSGSPGGKARGWRQSRSWRVPAVGRLMALLCALLPGACGCAQWTGLTLADATAPEGPARPACTFPASASEWGMPAPLSDTLEGIMPEPAPLPGLPASGAEGRLSGILAHTPDPPLPSAGAFPEPSQPCVAGSAEGLPFVWGTVSPASPCSGGEGLGSGPGGPVSGAAGASRARFRRVGAAVQGYGGGAVSEEENIRLVREIGEVKAELSGLKAEVAGTNQRLDDIVITQLKDHGKRLAMQDIRISSLEQAENRRAGGISALAAIATVAGSVGALLMKVFG